MKSNLKPLIKNLELNSGVEFETINDVEQRLGINFLTDYKEFISEANGAEGFVGQSYLILFPIEKLEEINRTNDYAPRIIKFASDGGGNVYVFDSSEARIYIGKVSSIGIGLEEIEFCGFSFTDFLKYLYEA